MIVIKISLAELLDAIHDKPRAPSSNTQLMSCHVHGHVIYIMNDKDVV